METLGPSLIETAGRVIPVLGFLVAITVVAEIAALAGVFDLAAHAAARAGRGRRWLLWLLLVAIAVVSTIVLSLDSTAVLLTPVAIVVARQVGMPPLPFAMTTLWLANTASLLLPVSNLTNLLALHRFEQLGEGLYGYLALSWAPALGAILGTVAVLALRHRRALAGRYEGRPRPAVEDRPLLIIAATCCLLLGPAFVAEVPPWLASGIAAVVLVVTVLIRRSALLREVSVPWLMVIGVSVLFVVVDLAMSLGLRDLLLGLTGTGEDPLALARLTGVGIASANVVNNLPAYLALESVALDSAPRLMALLIGVNVGPLITVWASLATLLWRQRCRAGGVSVSVPRLAAEGAVCVVVACGAALLGLILVT